MINIKYCFIIVTLFLFILIANKNLFATNIGRTVYGVLTETYNGTSIDNSSAGADCVHIYGSGYDNADRIEGVKSISVDYQNWFGIYFDSAQDMSAYSGGKLYFSAKVPTNVDITNTGNVFKLSDGVDRLVYFNSTSIKRVDNGSTILSTGISNDNAWHTYYIELSNFTGLNLSNITYTFIIGSTINDNTLLIDNVYWVKAPSETRNFNATVKNISNDEQTSDITWSQDCFRQSWKASDQYIELDLDQESTNWYIRTYLSNEKSTRNGLYCIDSDGSEIVLPMAWRIRPDKLPNGEDTLLIARYQSGSYGLYDIGKNPSGTDWYTWCPMREVNAGIDYDDVKIWNLKGLHTVVWDHDSYDSLSNYYERKPKIYFGADCSNALNGLTYTANIIIELVYE